MTNDKNEFFVFSRIKNLNKMGALDIQTYLYFFQQGMIGIVTLAKKT